jgi:large subunit ribosomal protein L19
MQNKFIEGVEAANIRKDLPKFEIGDTVSVGVRIVEGNKERVQPFIGVVIARRGHGMNETFTVRRIVADEGVERIFPLNSPRLANIEVKRHGKVRRSKLYYLRDRVGKARKLRERRLAGGREVTEAGGEARAEAKTAATKSHAAATTEVAATV